jgi:hypothetical protein
MKTLTANRLKDTGAVLLLAQCGGIVRKTRDKQ